jgi:hypothetical protein
LISQIKDLSLFISKGYILQAPFHSEHDTELIPGYCLKVMVNDLKIEEGRVYRTIVMRDDEVEGEGEGDEIFESESIVYENGLSKSFNKGMIDLLIVPVS